MAKRARMMGVRAAVFGLAAILASACASSRPAPIIYGNAPPPMAATAPAPLRTPSSSKRIDLTSIPFDGATAPLVLGENAPLECVPYARNLSGIQIWGDAVTWWRQAENKYVRSGRPAEGSVMVLRGWKDETRGHVAVVKSIAGDRLIRIDHANWMHKGEVSINVPVIDVSEANDWSEVRVWHIPGGYWGGRTYETEGFIHPFRLNGGAGLSG